MAEVAKDKPPSAAALKHAQRRTHRRGNGRFLTPIEKRAGKDGFKDPTISNKPTQPPDPQQDAGGGYNPNGDDIQE